MKRKLKNGNKVKIDITGLEKSMGLYIDSLKKLTHLETSMPGIPVFSSSNLIGEYSELLVCEKLNLVQEVASNKDYDATDSKGTRYQIKARFNDTYLEKQFNMAGKNEFGTIKKINGKYPFDYLVLVYYIDTISNPLMFEISSSNLDNCKFTTRNNGFKVVSRYIKKKFDELISDGLIKHI